MARSFAIEAVFPRIVDALELPVDEFIARAAFTSSWHRIEMTKEEQMQQQMQDAIKMLEKGAR